MANFSSRYFGLKFVCLIKNMGISLLNEVEQDICALTICSRLYLTKKKKNSKLFSEAKIFFLNVWKILERHFGKEGNVVNWNGEKCLERSYEQHPVHVKPNVFVEAQVEPYTSHRDSLGQGLPKTSHSFLWMTTAVTFKSQVKDTMSAGYPLTRLQNDIQHATVSFHLSTETGWKRDVKHT